MSTNKKYIEQVVKRIEEISGTALLESEELEMKTLIENVIQDKEIADRKVAMDMSSHLCTPSYNAEFTENLRKAKLVFELGKPS